MERIFHLLRQDKLRMKALEAVRDLSLPQCYIGAGFIRNLVWDHLHGKQEPTDLNDIDVVYFDKSEVDIDCYATYESQLNHVIPALNWQVRNQAHMHQRNNHAPYQSTLEAISQWIEKETAIAVRLKNDNELELISAFGIESLFALHLTPNPNRDITIFNHRVEAKNWLTIWPKLQVMSQ